MSLRAQNTEITCLKKYIFDPFSTIIKLAILSNKPPNSKISIRDNIIQIQESGYIQSLSRYYNNDSKCDINYLSIPIEIACKTFLSKDVLKNIPRIKTLFKCAENGINLLIQTYTNFPLITHCLKYYHSIIDSKLEELDKLVKLDESTDSNKISKNKSDNDQRVDMKMKSFSKKNDNRLISLTSMNYMPVQQKMMEHIVKQQNNLLDTDNLISQSTTDNKIIPEPEISNKQNIRSENSTKTISDNLNKEDNIAKKEDNIAKKEDDVAKKEDDVAKKEDNIAKKEDDIAKKEDDIAKKEDDVAKKEAANLNELYSDILLKKFNEIWTESKINILIDLIEYLLSEESPSDYVSCIETFMIPIDKEIIKLIHE